MGNSKIELASGETLLDLTADTITAAGLLNSMTAHGADGEPITGTLIDGLMQYYFNTYQMNQARDWNGYVFNMGFVPNIFLIYRSADTALSAPQDYRQILKSFYNYKVIKGDGTTTNTFRSLYYYSASGSAQIGGSSGVIALPYESDSIKGVTGTVGTATTPYRLVGTYHVFGLRFTKDATLS